MTTPEVEAQPRVTIARIPAGQSLELFSTLCGFFGAVLEGCQISAGDGYGTAAEVVNGDGVTERDIVVALRRATRKLAKGLPKPIPADEPDDTEDPLTLNRMTAVETGGVEFGIGGATEAAAELAKLVIGTFIPALEETNAVNYLSWDAVDPTTRLRYSLIFVKPDGLTPHEARQHAEAERKREHASRQDWAAEALRGDQLRDAIAEAAQLPADVSDAVLLAEITDLRDLVRSYSREVADIAMALGFTKAGISPDPADLLGRVNKLTVTPVSSGHEIRHDGASTRHRVDLSVCAEWIEATA